MTLPVGAVSGLSDVIASLSPGAVVIAGRRRSDDDVALWAYRVRAAAGALPTAVFRRRAVKVRTTGTRMLADAPFGAHRQLLAALTDDATGDDDQPARIDGPAPLAV